MKTVSLIISSVLLVLISCKKEIETQSSYLDQWTGEYIGTSLHYKKYYNNADGSWVNIETIKKVYVEVQKSNSNGAVDFFIEYNDSIIMSKKNIELSTSGFHSSYWIQRNYNGGLKIQFDADSLSFYEYSTCGQPSCEEGIDFKIQKK